MSCVVKSCSESTSHKAVLCKKHWETIPKQLQMDIRKGTEKGNHSLRSNPSREWLGSITKYVGDVKNLMVRVGYDNKVTRKLQEQPEEVVPASV